MHNGPYVTVTEWATRRRYVGKFHLSCSESGLLSSHARPVAPPPVTSANVIKTCIASRLLSLHVRPVGFVCLFFNRKQTSTVNASVGHCMKDRWPPPLVRSHFQKELSGDVVRSSGMGSLCPTKSMQVSSHVVCSQFHKEFAVDVGCYHFLYDPGPEPPLSILQLKENFKVNVSVIASTTRGFSALFSTTHVAVIACTPRGCTTRGSHACLLCNSKNTCSASRLLSTGCCGTACLTCELCLTVLQ